MGSCVSNRNDIIEARINNPSENYLNNYNQKKTKKHKSMPMATIQFNKCQEIKKSNKTLKTLCLNDISEIMCNPDNEDNLSINGDNTFKKIIEVFNI